MSNFIFEGEVEVLSARQQEFLGEILEKKGYKGNKVHIESVGKVGDNYVALVKRITVHGNDGNTFKMIAKVAPTHETIRANGNTALLFNTETIMYNEVLPKFTELQTASDVPKEEQLRYAEFYGALTEAPHELILLEDLQVSNFQILDRFQPLTNESVKLILKNFAILHSVSFVLKREEPETFESLNARLVDFFALIGMTPEIQFYLTNLENDCIKVLDNERYKQAVRNSVSQMGEKASKLNKYQASSRYLVIAQGDAWTNNLMFRLEEKQPVEAIMIDYQASKASSPAADLLYMIFNCTDHQTRLKHYHEWIDFYHSELDKSLSNYGIKSNYVYPRDQLDADLLRYSKTFFATCIMLSSVLIRTSEDASKIKESMEREFDENNVDALLASNLDPESVSLFKNRIEGLVDSFYEFGYLITK